MTPLPLIDGALHIDNSFLEALQTCPRALEYKHIVRRHLSSARPAISFGTAIHEALDIRYARYGDLDAITQAQCETEQYAALQEHFSQAPPPEGDWRDLNWAATIVKAYNEHYMVEPFNLLSDEEGHVIVERAFKIPFLGFNPESGEVYRIDNVSALQEDIHVPIFYTGRIDLPVSWDGHLIVLDHKTTSFIGDSFWEDLRVSPQQTGYCWAWYRLTGQKPIGFCVNAIRTRALPLRPKGGINEWWGENFQRSKEYLSDHHYDEWEQNTTALIEEFLWHCSRSYFPMKKKWCVGKYGRCQFYDVCYTPADQRPMMLESTEFEEYKWNPLD